jgi:CBS domain-containing protein
MRVSEVMTRGAECTSPDTALQEAAERMKSLNVGSLPVCDNDRLVGMLTDRDIVIRCVAEGKDPRSVHVRDAMTPGVVFCLENQDVDEAAKLMGEKQIRRLPVLDGNKRLVGMVSLGDLAVDTGDEQLVGQALEDISEPSAPIRR